MENLPYNKLHLSAQLFNFVTMLVYYIYLATRSTAVVLTATIFCYLGVNLALSEQHS